MDGLQLFLKISNLPSELKSEVNDFIDFLMKKKKKEGENKKNIKPQFGCALGQIIMSPDFDEPMEDFNEYIR